ncbi:hypothetical protein FB451DRAFT_1417091 [Mycena latifolia]|nr:hypothetical protein FB451DRAFT_1417091 [Mycena latifolia]
MVRGGPRRRPSHPIPPIPPPSHAGPAFARTRLVRDKSNGTRDVSAAVDPAARPGTASRTRRNAREFAGRYARAAFIAGGCVPALRLDSMTRKRPDAFKALWLLHAARLAQPRAFPIGETQSRPHARPSSLTYLPLTYLLTSAVLPSNDPSNIQYIYAEFPSDQVSIRNNIRLTIIEVRTGGPPRIWGS